MSNYLAIATVTATLRNTILPAVKDAIPGDEVKVTTQRPDDPSPANIGPRVNLYLYQVIPNAAWRNADLPTRRGDGTLAQLPQAALNLHYLLTLYGDENKLQPQRLLGRTVSLLHARPVLTREAIRRLIQNAQDPQHAYHFLITSDLAEQVKMVRFSPLPLNLEELSKLWSVFFQTPYSLSVAYQASVVLIEEAEEPPQAAPPVRDYNLYAVPFHRPVIEQVSAQEGANQPIVADSTLAIRGQRLRGNITKVMIAGKEVEPLQVSDTQINAQLSSLPAGALRVGIQAIQVVHQLSMGIPLEPHRGFESNVVAFVLQPTVTDPQAPDATRVILTFNPKVGRTQRVVLFLDEFNPPDDRPPRVYIFEAPPDNGIEEKDVEETESITFSISGVEAGDYLVSVHVDGAESPLVRDMVETSPTFNQYIDPKVTIP
jgi:hypothetical protein